jgi:Raf kinase inhibitor-like YbhB/YbcL family protein
METIIKSLAVQSPAFANNGHIPVKYTCDGDDVNPPLDIIDIPEDTQSLAIVVEDPDAPSGLFIHWLVWNLSPGEQIAEKTTEGVSGINDFGKTGYGGPCPPSGTHHYYFKIYALDKELHLAAGENRAALLEAMESHILASGELMGRYKRNSKQRSA